MRILVIGTNGQVGWELERSLLPLGDVIGRSHATLDLLDADAIASTLRGVRPDVVVNAAAYTKVDQAETNETIALRINGDAVGILAAESARIGALLIHYSTDYVFNGEKDSPYVETDPVEPLNVYGRSKLLGERLVADSNAEWLVFRTTWVYASRGNNFMRTMMRLGSEREILRVVGDQKGAPTSARFLADATAHTVGIAQRERLNGTFRSGIYHLTASGETTWHGFASTIIEGMREQSPPMEVKTRRVEAIASSEYPVPARRPKNSLLNNERFIERFGLTPPSWQRGLQVTFQEALTR